MKKYIIVSIMATLFFFILFIRQIGCHENGEFSSSKFNKNVKFILNMHQNNGFNNTFSINQDSLASLIELPLGYIVYSNINIWQCDGVNYFCSATKCDEQSECKIILFKTDLKCKNPIFIKEIVLDDDPIDYPF